MIFSVSLSGYNARTVLSLPAAEASLERDARKVILTNAKRFFPAGKR